MPIAMEIPLDITTLVTGIASTLILGTGAACFNLWVDMKSVKSELATLKALTATQGVELRTVAGALERISTDLDWIKRKLEEKH